MFTKMLSVVFLSAVVSAVAAEPARAPTMLFYGGGMVERLLENGELEARLQLAQPDAKLRVRSLAWTGDEVGWRFRPEGYVEHLKALLAMWPADVVVLGYGLNESAAGAAGLADFRAQLDAHLRELKRHHAGAKFVVLSPVAVEENSPANAEQRNRDVALYSAALADAAKVHGAKFVDLFNASLAAYAKFADPLTTQGIHLNDAGCREIAKVIAAALTDGARVDEARVGEIAKAAGQKSHYVAEVVRPKNAVVYFGVRKRAEEYAGEIPRYHELIGQAEKELHEMAADPKKKFADYSIPSLPPLSAGNSKPDRFGGGVIRKPAEQIKEFKVADGYVLNLFASEEQFPELRNPVQMVFDARGRLWVATMPSFPHTPPGAKPDDRVLILEDTDRDGCADKCTTFAGGFDAMDGIAFHERGVIVSVQPRLLLLSDTDGDDRADVQTELLRGVDVTDSHHGGNVSTDPMGDVMFCDGVFHRSQFETPFGVVRGFDSTTYRLNSATGRIGREWQALTPNPWKISFDRHGNIFQHYGGGHVLDGLTHTWTPLGIYHPYGRGTVLNYNKGCALDVISSANFPSYLQQGIAQGSLLGSYLVSLSPVSAAQGNIVATGRLDVISTPNAAFRPVDIGFGFDGAMYVADFCSTIIGHAQHAMRDPQWDHEHGRIWRVVYTNAPLVKEWPKLVGGTTTRQLLEFLKHPQNIVRHHARILLRGGMPKAMPPLDAWIASLDRADANFGANAMEALWVLQSGGKVRPSVLAEVAKSSDPMARVAAVQLIRFQCRQLPDAVAMLTRAAADSHPRVRMAAVGVVGHLREERPEFEGALAEIGKGEAATASVKQMVDDLKHGTRPARGRSVPVLDVAPGTELKHWIAPEGFKKAEPPKKGDAKVKKNAPVAGPKFVWATYVEAAESADALLAIKLSKLEVILNGVQVFSSDSTWSSEQQIPLALQRGLNRIEIAIPNAAALPRVNLFDPTGEPLQKVRAAANDAALAALAEQGRKAAGADDGTLRVQAVPNTMLFAPKELRVKAGQPVRLIFENPDLMPHNLVIVAPGAADEIGALADAMATQADAMAKSFIPVSNKILHFTPLIEPSARHELRFTAPTAPGRYPYICTFPGHWRIMRGELIVEAR